MVSNQNIKTASAISYFAHVFFECKGKNPTQTWIYKLLALLDYRVLKTTGKPCLGLIYDAHENGHVPMGLYNNRNKQKNPYYEFQRDDIDKRIYHVIPQKEPNLNCFSDFEVDEIERLCDVFLAENVKLEDLIEETHKEIESWKQAWKIAVETGRKKMEMNYEDEFVGLDKKPDEELTLTDDAFLISMGIYAMGHVDKFKFHQSFS